MENHEIPEERDRVNRIFDGLTNRLKQLDSGNQISTLERDKLVEELVGLNEEVRHQFLKEWHMVEAQDRIIQKLEYYLEVFGHDVESIRPKIMGDSTISELLKIARQ